MSCVAAFLIAQDEESKPSITNITTFDNKDIKRGARLASQNMACQKYERSEQIVPQKY